MGPWDRYSDHNLYVAIFTNFRRKNLRFSLKNNVMNQILQKLAVVRVKTPFFRQNFRRKYFLNDNIQEPIVQP
jgi:hypothetical protein